jgi:phage gp29-like protein
MHKIVDQHGRPFSTKQLKETQTARLGALSRPLLQSQVAGLTPSRAAQILRDADQGNLTAQAQLFADMLDRDAHLRSEYDKRTGALLTLDWSIEPPSEPTPAEEQAAEWVESLLRDTADDFEDLLLALADGIGHGFAAVEIAWERDAGDWIPNFHYRPQDWFQFSVHPATGLRLIDGSSQGAELWPMGWILHQHSKAKTGYLGRAGLLRTLVWPFIYKAYALGDMAEFLEIYGLPVILGQYMPMASEDEKSSLLRAVTALGRDARAIMPEGMKIEIQKVSASGDGTPHMTMIDWAERAQSKAVLGQTTSSEAHATGLGSGIANLHGEVRHDILLADARKIAGTLSRDLIYPLVALNLGGVDSYRRSPRFIFDTQQPEDISLYANALPALVQAGMRRIPTQWVHDKLNIPVAKEDEEALGVINHAPTGDTDQLVPALPRGNAELRAQASNVDWVDDRMNAGRNPTSQSLAGLRASAKNASQAPGSHAGAWEPDRVQVELDSLPLDDLQPQATDLMKPLIDGLKDGMSPEQALDALAELYPQMNSDLLTEALARAMFALELAGRLEAQLES